NSGLSAHNQYEINRIDGIGWLQSLGSMTGYDMTGETAPTQRGSGSGLVWLVFDNLAYKGRDIADLLGAYCVRHGVGMPLHRIAHAFQGLVAVLASLQGYDRVLGAVRHEDRRMLIGAVAFLRDLVGNGQITRQAN